jgi:hypothetical protein
MAGLAQLHMLAAAAVLRKRAIPEPMVKAVMERLLL